MPLEFAAAQALYGNLKIFFGAFEITGGVVLVASGNFIVGGILIAHGFDTALAGVIQVLNGDTTRTFTSKSIALVYEQSQRFSGLNLDPTRAHFVGEMGDLAIGMVDFGVSAFAVGSKVAAKVSRLIGKAKGLNRLDDARQVLNAADEVVDAARAGEGAETIDVLEDLARAGYNTTPIQAGEGLRRIQEIRRANALTSITP